MAKGWSIIAPLEAHDPDKPIDPSVVESVCVALSELNDALLRGVTDALFEKRFDDYAIELRSGYRNSDRTLFNRYFGVPAYSPCVPADPPKPIDGRRTAVLFYLSFDLQRQLLDHLSGIPTAKLFDRRPKLKPSEDGDAERVSNALTPIYRFVELGRVIAAIKGVQYDVEDFAFRAEDLLIGSDGSRESYRSSHWPYDSDALCEAILLGFVRGSEGIINPWLPTSAVVAAGPLRSHLEAVLLRRDFDSALKGRKPPEVNGHGDRTPSWEAALKTHRDNGSLTKEEFDWTHKTYNFLLSESLHAGLALSSGEVWMLRRVVRHIADRLAFAMGGGG